LNVYGNDWEEIKLQGWNKFPAVLDRPFTLAMNLSKLSLCLLRKSSQDVSTQRTFEIAPCGGCGIYEDTKEHREILASYPDYGFFSSPEDLAHKCHWLLENPVEREAMRQLGIKLVVNESNSYTARLKTILENTLD
jgi:spore maturation protein CgeB